MFDRTDDRWMCHAIGLLRIVTGLLFLQHGTAKIFGFPWVSSMAYPQSGSLLWAAGWMEVVGSVLLIAGLFTRPVAFILAGEMAVAYWMIHAQQSFYPMINEGEKAILFCFIFLLFAAAGPGKWSIDGWLRREDEDPDVEGYAAPGGERQYRPEDFGDKVI